MAFTPNMTAVIRNRIGTNIYGSPIIGEPREIQIAVVNARRKQEKTTVRSDSSASRGSTDQITTDLGRILVAKHEAIEIGDIISFDGDSYSVVSKHLRRTVFGTLDHYECDIEVLPR